MVPHTEVEPRRCRPRLQRGRRAGLGLKTMSKRTQMALAGTGKSLDWAHSAKSGAAPWPATHQPLPDQFDQFVRRATVVSTWSTSKGLASPSAAAKIGIA